MKNKSIKLTDISIDGETQQRERINTDTVTEYAESMRCGSKFPTVALFFDGVAYWLADGFHRYHASKEAGIEEIQAEVRDGTKRDARLFSASANGTHGMRLTNADKRRSVMVLLNDAEWSQWSNRDIAKHCHVTHAMVNKIRDQMAAEVETVSTLASRKVETVSTLAEESGKDEIGNEAAQSANLEHEGPADYNPDDPETRIQELSHALQDSAKEAADLTALVKSLEATDNAAEMAKLHERILGLEGRLAQETTTKNEAIKSSKHYKAMLDKIMAKVGVKKHSEIIGALK